MGDGGRGGPPDAHGGGGADRRRAGTERPHAGLAVERTQLAWNRSGLAVLIAVALMLRHLWPLEGYKTVAALALIASGAALWCLGMRQATRVVPGAPEPLGEAAFRTLTGATLLLAAAGLVVGAVL